MTGFMTAPAVLICHPACPPRVKEAQFQLICNFCRDSHKTQVWLCFLILSFLSTGTTAISRVEMQDLQTCLMSLKSEFEKSDAVLYAPSFNDIKDNCIHMGLRCYMLELSVVIVEEDIKDEKVDFIFHYNTTLHPEDGCPACETYPLANITVFLDRLMTISQAVIASQS